MSEIKKEYKGETITFSEYYDEWEWSGKRNASLKKLRDVIDRAHRVEFERKTAILINYRDINSTVTVTSQVDGEEAFWVTDTKKTRSKEHSSHLFADTEENKAKIFEMNEIRNQISQMREQVNAIKDSMERFSTK